MRNLIIILFLIIFCYQAISQIKFNFSDGSLSQWQGDVASFKVDDQFKLRLNAPDAGQATIYTPCIYPDSFTLNIDVKLEFNPSASNATKIYFLTQSSNILTSSGYFLLIGENGNNDALKIYRKEGATETLIASSKEGKFATDPSKAKIKLTYRNQGEVKVEIDYDEDGLFDEELLYTDKTIKPNTGKFFGINCVFTATRKDKFVYDNIEVEEFFQDKTPPQLIDLKVIDNKNISLFFNEAIEQKSAGDIKNYNVVGFGNPETATIIAPTQVRLTFKNAFISEKTYTLEIIGIRDLVNNIENIITRNFSFSGGVEVGELVISEILFDPYVNQQDFIELYNSGTRPIQINGLKIKNFKNNQEITITKNYTLEPKKYIAISPDILSVKNTYNPSDTAIIIQDKLPAFNNDAGNISILSKEGTLLDSFNYIDDIHLILDSDKNIEGVSLEKVILYPFYNERPNWISSARSVKYATPGYANSLNYDFIKPTIKDLKVINNKTLVLVFDDVISITSVENLNNYTVDNQVGIPVFSDYDKKINEIKLDFGSEFSSSKNYILTVENVVDKNNNKLDKISLPFRFGIDPKPGDIIISEILFAPYSEAQDYVELYNVSENGIQLDRMTIKNFNNNQAKVLPNYVLPPKTYVAISSDIKAIKNYYNPPDTARILKGSLPAFNIDKGNVSLILNNEVVDSFNYYEELHNTLIDKEDRKGVSLEKILLKTFANGKTNWHSSAKANNYGTPGYKNSNYFNLSSNAKEDNFYIDEKVFSPDNDGNKDLLFISYKLPESGYIANIDIYNSSGYKVKTLAKNELLGTEGILKWDGSNDDGYVEKIGIYILSGTIFSSKGEVSYFRKEGVLAKSID